MGLTESTFFAETLLVEFVGTKTDLLGNEQIATNLCDFLVAAARETGMVSDKTVEYWRNALKG
ncbi:TPA: hypothetical protein NKR29_004484 [Vibrio parahaemolyticus]|nr:hypothetical protein [Vibrio parahaemolyticus]